MEYNFFATSSKPSVEENSIDHLEERKYGEHGLDLSLTLCPPTKSCTSCGKTKTPMWRNGPDGPKTLCNACGIRYSREKMRMSSILTLAPPTSTRQTNGRRN